MPRHAVEQRVPSRAARTSRRAERFSKTHPPETGVRIKRAYDPPDPADGYRVLVDRLWPRGIKKEALALDEWHKELAPSDALRRWFGHDPERWEEFCRRYQQELQSPRAEELLGELGARAAEGRVTLVYGAQDRDHNNAIVLLQEILARIGCQ